MRHSLLVLSLVAATSACTYKSVYLQKSSKTYAPTSPSTVKVVDADDDAAEDYTALGEYRGKAPTADEALENAKKRCGEAGAHMYVLFAEPFPAGSGYEVRGMCARMGSGEGKGGSDAKPTGTGKPLGKPVN